MERLRNLVTPLSESERKEKIEEDRKELLQTPQGSTNENDHIGRSFASILNKKQSRS